MIRNNIKRIAIERELSVTEMSRITGVHRQTLVRIYHNQTANISFETLDALCSGLDLTTGDILQYIPNDKMTPYDVKHLQQRYAETRERSAKRKKAPDD